MLESMLVNKYLLSGFWLAGGCAASQSDARFEQINRALSVLKSLLTNKDFCNDLNEGFKRHDQAPVLLKHD